MYMYVYTMNRNRNVCNGVKMQNQCIRIYQWIRICNNRYLGVSTHVDGWQYNKHVQINRKMN